MTDPTALLLQLLTRTLLGYPLTLCGGTSTPRRQRQATPGDRNVPLNIEWTFSRHQIPRFSILTKETYTSLRLVRKVQPSWISCCRPTTNRITGIAPFTKFDTMHFLNKNNRHRRMHTRRDVRVGSSPLVNRKTFTAHLVPIGNWEKNRRRPPDTMTRSLPLCFMRFYFYRSYLFAMKG
jgi:hypothetical protein